MANWYLMPGNVIIATTATRSIFLYGLKRHIAFHKNERMLAAIADKNLPKIIEIESESA